MESTQLPQTLASIPDPVAYAGTRDFSVGIDVTPTPGPSFPIQVKFPVNGKLYPDTPWPGEGLAHGYSTAGRMVQRRPTQSICMGLEFLCSRKTVFSCSSKGWKDTVELSAFGIVDSALDLREEYPGDWLYHCHFENHMQDGLMGSFIVLPPASLNRKESVCLEISSTKF